MKRFLLISIVLIQTLFSQRVVGYYPHWVFNNFAPEDIDLDVVTHVIHAFAWPNADGSIDSYDGMFGSGISEVIHAQDRKFILSLGGWGNDSNFEIICADPNLREFFINNLISIILINGYDGADIDWEFPDSETDRTNLNLLVSEMRSAFDQLDPDLLITMAIPVSNWWGQWTDFEFLTNHIDFYNAMTYGTHGDWSSHAGHLAPLYPSPSNDPDGSCDYFMNYLINSRSIPSSKLNMGLPFWGLMWDAPDINEPFSGSSADIIYYNIPELIGNGWSYNWDSDALCPFLTNDNAEQIITYEDPESIRHKCEYVKDQNIGGLMIWALSYDNTENGQELVQSIEQNYLKVDPGSKNLLPEEISINTYPNPFNPLCTIDLNLRSDQLVKLTAYNILGKEHKISNDKFFINGNHTIKWDASNLPNGVYLIKAESINQSVTKKVTLLK